MCSRKRRRQETLPRCAPSERVSSMTRAGARLTQRGCARHLHSPKRPYATPRPLCAAPHLQRCMLTEPVVPVLARTILTNSAKYAHYGPGLIGRRFRFANLEGCVAASITGRAPTTRPAWLGGATGAARTFASVSAAPSASQLHSRAGPAAHLHSGCTTSAAASREWRSASRLALASPAATSAARRPLASGSHRRLPSLAASLLGRRAALGSARQLMGCFIAR